MPETFGSGVAPTGWDPRAVPFPLEQISVPDLTTITVGIPSQGLVLLTSMEITSDGGGTGGLVLFRLAVPNIAFLPLNIGHNVDAFSWRGSMAIPPTADQGIVINNDSDTTIEVVMTALLCPYFVPE